uniref:Cold acclimation protein-related n=1 Tax=Musa acuminata TaxID=4641 RepID=Q1EPD6_MUSAC|nr:cold acclimation protein-related [Musa acuminata]
MRNEYLRMKTDYAPVGGDDLIQSDLKELGVAARKLANHALMVGGGLGVGTTFFKFLASFAAMSVFLDFRGIWKMDCVYCYCPAPFLPSAFPRDGVVGVFICLAIGCYLLQEHIRASGGFRNSFTKSHGVSNSIGIILLLVYPIWRLVLHFL